MTPHGIYSYPNQLHMITLDKIKIVVPARLIDVDKDHPGWSTSFTPNPDPDADEKNKYLPTHLTHGSQKETRSRHRPNVSRVNTVHRGINYMGVNYAHPKEPQLELVITGKILDNPARLISLDTVEEACAKINAMGMIHGFAPGVLREAQLLSADITRDCTMNHCPDEYTALISKYYTGKDFVQARNYAPNIQLQHKSKTREYTRTLTGYNKYRETNGEYSHPNTLRWELRLNSFPMLRKYLKLPPGSIKLLEALDSPANPIAFVFDEIMKGIQLSPAMNSMKSPQASLPVDVRALLFATQELKFDEKAYFARLKEVSFNLAPLEAELKGNKNAARKLKPYKKIYTRWQGYSGDTCHEATLLTEMLNKIKGHWPQKQ